MSQIQDYNQRQLKRIFYRRLSLALWISFLAAAAQTMVFFAAFDPGLLADIMTWENDFSIMQTYTIGFFFFWFFTAVAAVMAGVVMVLPRTKLAKRIDR